MTNNYPEMNWVTAIDPDDNFVDYRPAIGPDGQKVVFERIYDEYNTQLYVVDDLKEFFPHPFLNNCDSSQQTRPAWSGDSIVLNLKYNGSNSVWTADTDGNNLKEIPNTKYCIYPQWAIQQSLIGFVVMNRKHPKFPCSTFVDLEGKIGSDLNGRDEKGNEMFGGMPAVFPNQSKQIAYAGQPYIWSDSRDYNENKNYIFLNSETSNGFVSVPMEKKANIEEFEERFQGRAPAISPDGNYVAFESNRDGCYAIYLFDLRKPESQAVCLTDPTGTLNAQHPKFFPDGRKLIFSAWHEYRKSRIAWINIPEHL